MEFRYSQTIFFFVVHGNFTYDYLEISHSESSQTTAMELVFGKLVEDLRSSSPMESWTQPTF